MPEQRSVLKEYRYLDEKRLSQGLSPEEEARFARLRELVGPDLPRSGVRPGFDVNAAAAALRESLLPAGLRHRPPPTPTPAPAPAQPEPAPAEPAMGDALASAYEQAPFVPVDEGAPSAQPDAFFDPSSLGAEPPPYDPNAPPYDPNAQPYDPNAQPYDPSAYPADAAYEASGQPAWDPNQPWDPGAAPEAQPPYDPNVQPYDPNAQPFDPNAQPYDPSAYPADAAHDASGQPAWDPNQPWDPSAAPEAQPPYDPNAQPYDPSAYPADAAHDASGQPTWDPSQPWDPSAAPGAQPYDPNAAYPADAAQDAGAAEGWDAAPPPPEPTPGAAFGEYDAAGAEPPFAESALLGEVPPEPEAAAEVGQVEPAALPLGEYDDTAGFAAEPFEASAVPEEALALESARPPPELELNWQPESALDAGFQAESGGSFGAGADAAAPEWAQAPAPPPWEGAPPLDLDAAPEPADAEGSQGYEVSPAPPSDAYGAPAAAGSDLFAAPPGDLAPAEEPVAGAPVADAVPDLDFSHPDFSTPEEARDEAGTPAALASDFAELPPEEPEGEPPRDELVPPAPAEPMAEPAPHDVGLAEPVVTAELAEPPPEPMAGAVEAAPAKVAPPAEPEVAELAVTEIVEEAAAVPPAPEPPPAEPSAVEPPPAEEEDEAEVSFEVAEQSPVVAEDDIPTIDGADILEEIVEDAPTAPPQSLDFEPLPARPAAAPQAVVPPQPPEPPPAAGAAATPPAAAAPQAPPLGTTPASHIPGSHRVVVHTVEGLVKRGVLEDPDLDAATLALAPQPGTPAEEVPTDKVKAIFFMLAPGEKAPAAEGRKVRVTFRDGRQIAGFSKDYREDGIGFFMIPADTKTNTGRIWVFRAAVRQVSVG